MYMSCFFKPEWKKYIAGALIIAAVIFSLKYGLPLVLPFFLALCIVAPMYPFLEKAEKKLHIGKSALAGGILILLAAVILTVFWYLFAWGCSQLSAWMGNLDMVEDCFCDFVRDCSRMAEKKLGINADGMERMVLERTDVFLDEIQTQAVPRLMNRSASYIRTVFTVGGFLVITLIATILLAKDYGTIKENCARFALLRTAGEIGVKIGRLVLTYLKAQGLIMLAICFISMAGLYLTGIGNAVMTGLMAGLLDALPFIGTGIVLLPIAFWQILQGKIGKAFCCLAVYAVCALTREFLEPKLIGKKMGMYPAAVLLLIYAGIKIYGLSGVLLGPFSFLIIREIFKMQKQSGDRIDNSLQEDIK